MKACPVLFFTCDHPVKKAHAKFKDISMEDGLVGMGIPLHPGARKFFMEKGVLQ
jgi:hypothetical protein